MTSNMIDLADVLKDGKLTAVGTDLANQLHGLGQAAADVTAAEEAKSKSDADTGIAVLDAASNCADTISRLSYDRDLLVTSIAATAIAKAMKDRKEANQPISDKLVKLHGHLKQYVDLFGRLVVDTAREDYKAARDKQLGNPIVINGKEYGRFSYALTLNAELREEIVGTGSKHYAGQLDNIMSRIRGLVCLLPIMSTIQTAVTDPKSRFSNFEGMVALLPTIRKAVTEHVLETEDRISAYHLGELVKGWCAEDKPKATRKEKVDKANAALATAARGLVKAMEELDADERSTRDLDRVEDMMKALVRLKIVRQGKGEKGFYWQADSLPEPEEAPAPAAPAPEEGKGKGGRRVVKTAEHNEPMIG